MVKTPTYSAEFKAQLVQKACQEGAPSPYKLAKDAGVPPSSLYRWIGKSERSAMATKKARRPKDWTPSEKLKAVVETANLAEEALGLYLRKNGLHSANLEEWRSQAQAGIQAAVPAGQAKALQASKRVVKGLQKELRRKNAALAETAALLVLSKKVNALWGGEGDDT